MDRGGNALRDGAVDSERIDQRDYPESQDQVHGGLCEGMVREVMRRMDVATTPGVPTTVSPTGRMLPLTAVQGMRADASRSSPARNDMFGRINNFQNNRTGLRFNHYTSQAPVTLDRTGTKQRRIERFLDRLHDSLQKPDDMAYVQLALVKKDVRRGHALLIQRGPDNRYSIFDPNNGAFQYADWDHMAHALERYLNSAFQMGQASGGPRSNVRQDQYDVIPFKMQVYSNAQHAGTPVDELPPQQGAAGISPPDGGCDDIIYKERSTAWSDTSLDALFPQGSATSGLHSPNESVGSYALQEVASGRSINLLAATNLLRGSLSNPYGHQGIVDALNVGHERYQTASTTVLPNHTRHSGVLHTANAGELVTDLRTHFSEPYVSEDATTRHPNDFAVVDLTLNPRAASGSNREPSRPVIIQRMNTTDDYASDQYQVYDPNSGVFVYQGFQNLASTMRRIYDTGYSDEGGVHHATTTWFSNDSSIADTSLPALERQPPSPVRNVTLLRAEHAGGLEHANDGAHVPENFNLPPEPADNRPSIQDYVRAHIDELKKRSVDSRPDAEPRLLFRPSTETPEEVNRQGGFDAEWTPLSEINLRMHNFDVASHEGETDSAGYLGTFALPSVAVIRQQHQPRPGYVYVIAASPNMVDVNGSLGPHALERRDREYAAMGHIDNTQVVGWWRTEDLHNNPATKYTPNHNFRWDVYDHLRTAGAQPQLARFPAGSSAWQEPAYRPFAGTRRHNDQTIAAIPKEDPNRTQAAFYLNAMMKINQAAAKQSNGEDYRGPMTIEAYGGGSYILYTDRYDRPYIAEKSSADKYPENTRQFAMGEDGRLHYPKNYNKVILVGSDGYLRVGPIPEDPEDLNGVFRFSGGRLVHAKDNKYLNVGYGSSPFVANYQNGSWSQWGLKDPAGHAVTPPMSNRNSYSLEAMAYNRRKLYAFSQDPDSALPAGTTHFATELEMLDIPPRNMQQNIGYLQYSGATDVVAPELFNENAAWLFKDGYYATATSENELQVRTVSGEMIWEATHDKQTGWTWRQAGPIVSTGFPISDEIWNGIKAREIGRLDQEDKLAKV
ncbi:enterotoxin A family protein [Paraburkholderia sediminicola]|uniref:enterotoxin A family protein n=1 Tax=Paraburkholderia sediminicola TaxID=458836 RepID=UPI0038B90B98